MSGEKFKLKTISVFTGNAKDLGVREYLSIPRIGEWIEMVTDEDGRSMHEVIMVMNQADGTAPSVYVTLVEDTEVLLHLGI